MNEGPVKRKKKKKFEPLDIRCTSADCPRGLHCFKPNKKMRVANKEGRCRYCGVQLVDWKRLHTRELDDVSNTFKALKYEMWRHHYWHINIDQRAINYAKRKGKTGLRIAVESRIRKYLPPANSNPYDGRQTSKTGNPICYGQHATAICCRKCMEYWHGIPRNNPLTEEEIEYFADLIMLYIEERISDLTSNGEKVPPIRKLQE